MRIGIDMGTTRTIAAGADRGNYPVLRFADLDGDQHDHFPSVIADVDGELVHGFAAERAARAGAPHLRSFKRLLGAPGTHPGTTVELGGQEHLLLDLVTAYLVAVREALPVPAGQVAVSVPAHAHSAQRIMTLEAFRRAGIDVIAMLNEPSAAGFEYTHHQSRSLTSRRTRIAVYDLGGGTFDSSLVEADGTGHVVLGSHGDSRLGGDDLDEVLLELVLERVGELSGLTADTLGPAGLAALREECRAAKERLLPQTRRMMIDLGQEHEPVILPVEEFYAAATPLVERTLEVMAPLVGELEAESGIAGIYLVGGGSGLPLVGRRLRERFGRRVHRSPYPAASTAIGLAIAADPDADVTLADRLSRGISVFREAQAGEGITIDQVLTPDEPLPATGVTTVTRTYTAAHTVGWFRFVEHAHRDPDGELRGDVVPCADVLFPFDPALRELDPAALARAEVTRREGGPRIEERYSLHPSGAVTVQITDLDSGFSREYGLARRG
ncbi:Hsp70 family protein [Brachybacterium saurashtrense]|uniref:Hsp70 family protein n=1 Tax=Brachybacterium saurashtrense TaxID=556288 RepID=A0A345YRT3_9MICO|nr:Hsp70 family protein [Brachybacterium saurashtrense]AXK46635.1 Hsp70 family protein [Brachybacterium saurashtrense]RRR20780.1 Hsp70 family protein [Brachybacterium saurashtrense]